MMENMMMKMVMFNMFMRMKMMMMMLKVVEFMMKMMKVNEEIGEKKYKGIFFSKINKFFLVEN